MSDGIRPPEARSLLTVEERRIRRLERREKQRKANGVRAGKMHEARMMAASPSKGSSRPPRVNVGCSGWFYWHWRTSFYPDRMPPNEWFEYYSSRFRTVELNAPFYSWPTVHTVKRWRRQAEERDIIYTVKVCELITHVKRFVRTKTLVLDFGYIADLLGKHMGCFLFQLPPSYRYSPSRLKTIVGQLDPTRRNVVEFRHRSWWNEAVYSAFRKAGIIFCSCSAPKLPEDLVVTTEEVYIRFHGTAKWYRHDYTNDELTDWVKRIKAARCKRVWVYFNNDRDAKAPKNASEFIGILKKKRWSAAKPSRACPR